MKDPRAGGYLHQMSRAELPTRKLVLVEWVDSHSGNGWRPLDEIQKTAIPVHCRSVGWLVAKTEDTTVLVSSISGEQNGNMRLYGDGDIAIPNQAIVKTTVLRKGAARKRDGTLMAIATKAFALYQELALISEQQPWQPRLEQLLDSLLVLVEDETDKSRIAKRLSSDDEGNDAEEFFRRLLESRKSE